ncbi:unnamed protein product [Nippostrongylus brasiliensis]|uniref:Uncharacterized protein n=1 Tax=Nippostrongylus brasiliensis TaxID=27835 RepID=A0A0N4YQK5_NIPBR|nr:unnamed protein product [Nippostrongylus brasiliensis]
MKAPPSAASDAPALGGSPSPIEGIKKANADLVAWCYKSHGAAADDQLKKLDNSGVKREHVAYGVIAVLCLYLMGGEEAMFLSYVITFFYPASVSIDVSSES